LRKAMRLLGFCIFAYSVALGQDPSFEVASVRPSGPMPARSSFEVTGGPGSQDPERFTARFASLQVLVMEAYGIPYDYLAIESNPQVTGPDWTIKGDARYDVAARIPPGATKEQFRFMLQGLLKERFNLTIRHETKQVSGYVLTVEKSGAKLKETPDPDSPKGLRADIVDGRSAVTVTNQSILRFVQYLSRYLDTYEGMIVDRTGLNGRYDFKFEVATVLPSFFHYPYEIPSNGPSIFEALEKQLGLKLEKSKVSVDMLVIDHADRVPAEN